MKKILLFLLFCFCLLPSSALAQETKQSNSFCTKVGTPTEPKPNQCLDQNSPANLVDGTFTYFCQGNLSWDNRGGCGTGQVGCGPTSIAMIFNYFKDYVNPGDVFSEYKSKALLSCEDGSYPGKVNVWLKEKGYDVRASLAQGKFFDAAEGKKYIDKGFLILGSSQEFKVQKGVRYPHIFVIQDVNPQANTILIRDPENCDYGTGEEIQANKIQPIIGDKIPTWAYAYPIKKL